MGETQEEWLASVHHPHVTDPIIDIPMASDSQPVPLGVWNILENKQRAPSFARRMELDVHPHQALVVRATIQRHNAHCSLWNRYLLV